jgi:8-oxo-dGTP diphosphatase
MTQDKLYVAVDCAVFTTDGRLLLVERRNEPFKGVLALPGGFMNVGESAEEACRRELGEETHVEVSRLLLVGQYSEPNRDPRGHVVSLAFTAVVDPKVVAGSWADDDAVNLVWLFVPEVPATLAFDHNQILEDAIYLASRDLGLPTF